MLSKFLTIACAILALFQGVRSQRTTVTALPFDMREWDGLLDGEVRGSGPDGTTYVVSALISGQTVTATIVNDGNTHVQEVIEYMTGNPGYKFSEECTFNAEGRGPCIHTDEYSGSSFAVTLTETSSSWQTFGPMTLDVSTGSSAFPAFLVCTSVMFTIASVVVALVVLR